MTTDSSVRSTKRTYLIYVVLDTSDSMRQSRNGEPPLDIFIQLIPRMLKVLADHPVANGVTSVSVLAFNDKPEVLRPMTPVSRPTGIAPPAVGYATDYARVLKFLVTRHAQDVRSVKLAQAQEGYSLGVARPWVFFITDGLPYANEANQAMSEWTAHRDELTGDPIGARIVALGLPGADERTLWHLATGDEDGKHNAFIAEPGADQKDLPISVIDAILNSISTSVGTGQLTIRTPLGMRRIEGPRHA